MSAIRQTRTAALACALVATLMAGSGADAATNDGVHRSDGGGVALAQAGVGAERAPGIFHGMMIPELRTNRDCRLPEDIHKRLKRQGWWDFQNLERAGDHFTISARRPNGTAYLLTIDGCSGRVLEAKRVDGAGQGYRLWPR